MNKLGMHTKRAHPARPAGKVVWIWLTLALGMSVGGAQAVPASLNVPELGSASRFTVLSAAPDGMGEVTTTRSMINGDVGTSGPLSSVIQTAGSISGSIIAPVTAQVLADFNRAYDAFAPIPCDRVLTGALAGITLPPGVYGFDAAATLTGQLTLDGPANGIWLIKVGGGLTGTSLANVLLAGGARAKNVFWWVVGAATMTDSNFVGTILASENITLTRGTYIGNALAKGSVTLTDTTASKAPAQSPQSESSNDYERAAR